MSVQFNNCNISKKDEPCGICREPLDNDLVSHEMANKVQHVFHESCIAEWFKVRPACALCNAKVSEIKGLPISDYFDYLAIKKAVSSGDLVKILELINGPNFPKLSEFALKCAIEINSAKIIQALLPVSEKDTRGNARVYPPRMFSDFMFSDVT